MKILKQLHSIFLLAVLAVCAVNPAIAERTTTYFHSDGVGSIVAASDENGDLLWRKQYQPFGTQIDDSNISEPTSFTGKQHDDITGLTYFGARYYDPMLGRFVSTDPVSPLAGVESSPYFFNRYAYANSNPYRYVDPDGRDPNDVNDDDDSDDIEENLVTLGASAGGNQNQDIKTHTISGGFLGGVATKAKSGNSKSGDSQAKKKTEESTKKKEGLPDNAIVCRGGSCTEDRFTQGSGVTTDSNGKLSGVSVNSAVGKALEQLTQSIPHKKVGVTTVGDVRNAGGNVIASPNDKNPNHATLSGITAKQAEKLMNPTVKNPSK